MTGFEDIYAAYFSDVFLYARKLSGNDNIAEEITSDTFFKAMRSLKSFRGDCDVRVWLCQIAKNTYYSYLKEHSRFAELKDLEDADTSAPTAFFEEAFADRDEAMHIHSLLHGLPDPYKEVFMLRTFGELRFSQIAQLFGKTENWACVTYHRARTKIKEKMEDPHHEE